MSKGTHYVLRNREPVLVDLMTWARELKLGDRKVGATEVGEVRISTVFFGLDHQFGDGPPLLFETMVFGGPLDQETVHYSTWKQAEEGHSEMVRRVEEGGVK
jgi:hypothetical protein